MNFTGRGFDLYYDEVGQGIPLLCLPAFPFDSGMYREQRALDDVARVILPDYRGTGRSSYTDGPYTMDLLADDMFALLDALSIDKAVVLGVSMGCYTAFSMYEKHPERFMGFVIADTRAEADSPETAERRRRTVEGLRERGTAFLRERVSDLFAKTSKETRLQLVEEMQAAVLDQQAEGLAQITLGMAMRPDRVDLLPRIAVPTLVICGEEDTVSPPEGMRRLAKAIPNAEFQLIPQAGHLSPLEQPDIFNDLVRQFLTRIAT